MPALQDLLTSYSGLSRTEREKGTYFELLIKDFLKNDPTYSPQFSDVWTYAEWADLQGITKRDDGIDLVASLADGNGFCAIQCKFYDENYRVQKSDLDSFFTASGKKEFTRRLIVDSTRGEWSEPAKKARETDKTTVIYNHAITMTHIPLKAYEYVVNGKPALEWVMERQAVTKHKDSGIVNDANDWAIETMHDAAYPLKLFQRMITVSLETMKIVKGLPRLDIAANQA